MYRGEKSTKAGHGGKCRRVAASMFIARGFLGQHVRERYQEDHVDVASVRDRQSTVECRIITRGGNKDGRTVYREPRGSLGDGGVTHLRAKRGGVEIGSIMAG